VDKLFWLLVRRCEGVKCAGCRHDLPRGEERSTAVLGFSSFRSLSGADHRGRSIGQLPLLAPFDDPGLIAYS